MQNQYTTVSISLREIDSVALFAHSEIPAIES